MLWTIIRYLFCPTVHLIILCITRSTYSISRIWAKSWAEFCIVWLQNLTIHEISYGCPRVASIRWIFPRIRGKKEKKEIKIQKKKKEQKKSTEENRVHMIATRRGGRGRGAGPFAPRGHSVPRRSPKISVFFFKKKKTKTSYIKYRKIYVWRPKTLLIHCHYFSHIYIYINK